MVMNEMETRPSRPIPGQVLPNQRPAEVLPVEVRAIGSTGVCAGGRHGSGVQRDAGGVRRAGGHFGARYWTTRELGVIAGLTPRQAMEATGRSIGSIKKAARTYGIALADGRNWKYRSTSKRERVIAEWRRTGSRRSAALACGVPYGTATTWITEQKRSHGAA